MSLPKVTIGIISCNRLKYLKATLESARKCIQYPNLEWIVVDNASREEGLVDYLKGQEFIDELVLNKERDPQREHTNAMNKIVEKATGEFVFIWPEDVQFILEGDWLIDFVNVLTRHPWIGSLCINCLRGKTLKNLFDLPKWQFLKKFLIDLKIFGKEVRTQKVIRSDRGMKFYSMGWREEGIIGSGIPSLTRTDVWRTLGPWVSKGARPGLVDSSGGGEDEMLTRWGKSEWPLHRVIPVLPVAADIVTDDIGCKAKVRGEFRYGEYPDAQDGSFYYKILSQNDYDPIPKISYPISFEEMVKPLGFELPLDDQGTLLKASVNESKRVAVAS
tara:strand:- start:90 stop:1082 length:993 start_codon:yes stop_codon:yes gene_type:complete